MVFRTTPERYAEAESRHPETARRMRTLIDWDLDNFDDSMMEAEVLMTWDLPTADLRERAPKLKWIHIIGAGVEHLAPFDWVPEGLTITNNAGIHMEKTMEYVTMAIQMLNNSIPKFATDQRNARWDAVFSTPVAGKTVLIVGVGKMGTGAARAARKLGCRILGIRRSGKPSRYVDEMYLPGDLMSVMPRADFVIVNTPLTPETSGLIGDSELSAMKPEAGLINLARAAVVDYAALSRRLERRELAGAILDVHDPEPLPPESPYWHTPNMMLTPHVSSDDDRTYVTSTLDLLFENMDRLITGRQLKNRVNPDLGY